MSVAERDAGRALLDALDAPEAFDAAARALPEGPLAPLIATIDPTLRARIEEARPAPRGALAVGALVPHGGPGLWLATAWTRDALRDVRHAPDPRHEQWDALLGIHAARVEAPWMVGALVAALGPTQASLRRRIGLGVTRRFGERGAAIVAWCAAEGEDAERRGEE